MSTFREHLEKNRSKTKSTPFRKSPERVLSENLTDHENAISELYKRVNELTEMVKSLQSQPAKSTAKTTATKKTSE